MENGRQRRVWLRTCSVLLAVSALVLEPGTADSQVLAKAGDFSVVTGGNPSFSVTGVGFQPQAVIFFWTKQTAGGFSPEASVGYGFATGSTNQAAVAFAADDNQDTTDGKRWQSQSRCIVILTSAALGTTDAEATFTSMDPDGFTINWPKKGSSGWRVHYVAIGGPDIRNSTVGSFTPAAGTGTETVTAVGFEPDFLMFLSIDSSTLDAAVADAKVSLGFAGRNAIGDITNGAITAVSGNATANSKSFVRQMLGRAILERDTGLSAVNETMEAEVTDFVANGFTLEKIENDPGTESLVHYLALRGAQYKVGAITKPATEVPPNPAFSTTTTGVGFEPSALLFTSKNIAGSANANEEGRISFSVSDGTNERATVFHDKNSADPTKVRQANSIDKVAFLAQADCPEDAGACSGTERVISEADVASFDFDGFTLDWTTNITASPPLNDPGNENNAEILYLAVGRTWPDLQTSEGAGTFTVTAPDWFEMTFSEITGWGANTFYDLAEDATRTYDLAGTETGSVQALNHFGIRHPTGPTWYNTSRNDLDPRLDVIEATPLRVKLRQESFFQESGTTNILGGVKGIGDHTVYTSGKAALHWNRTSTSSVSYIEQDMAVGVHREASGPLNDLTGYSETGLIPTPPPNGNPGSDTFILMERDIADVRTDFLVILDQSWLAANRVDFTDTDAFASWRDIDSGTVGASESWNFLTYFKPTDFVDHSDPAVTGRRDDYQGPDPLAVISPGAGWDENGDGNFFNEGEAAYGFDLDPSAGLTFDVSGDVTPRYSPFFKIRQWRSLRDPDTVTLNGVPLTNDLHYKAEVKPVSDADFASDVLFHTTLENFAAVTSPDIGDGTGSTESGTPAYVAARYGSAPNFDVGTKHITIPLLVNGRQNLDMTTGRIELWFQPSYDSDDCTVHAYVFDIDNNNNLGDGSRIRLKHESSSSLPASPCQLTFRIQDGSSSDVGIDILAANYHWKAGEWVHLAADWDGTDSTDNVNLFLNGKELVPTGERNATFTMAAADTNGRLRIGQTLGATPFDPSGIIDEVWVYDTPLAPTRLARGGLTGDANEYLADGTGAKNFALNFAPVDPERRGDYLYLGSDSKFRGLNISLETPGVGTLPDLQWEYWNGTAWADLEAATVFTDETSSLTEPHGTIYWDTDPPGWSLYSVNGSTDLYYVRAHLASGSYSTPPTEGLIKTDILLFQYNGDVTAAGQTFDFGVPVPTAVELVSFDARGRDQAVELSWETASELSNLGFHLYRSGEEAGPYRRITAFAIPGLGSSPSGARYRYVDRGLTNGKRYYYQLEDIETTGQTDLHGPVSAVPRTEANDAWTPGPESETDPDSSALITFGDPEANELRVETRGSRGLVLELKTEGFYAEPSADGTVRISIPGFAELNDAMGLPVKRTAVEALAGRKVELSEARVNDLEWVEGLRLEESSIELQATRRGAVRLRRRARGTRGGGRGLYPSEWARVSSVGFQGETKKAFLELAPLRWDSAASRLLLARRLMVRVFFTGREPSETRGRGRAPRRRLSNRSRGVIARLGTSEPGLYRVSFEELFGKRSRAVDSNRLRLSRQGRPVAYHLEPSNGVFGPGSLLYFLSAGEKANPYGTEAVYEVEVGSVATRMPQESVAARGESLRFYWKTLEREENRYYQAGLLRANDLWQWDVLFAPATKHYDLEVKHLAAVTEPARLTVWLQGASDFQASPDHHVRVYVNGTFLGESYWEGKRPERVELELGPGLLREGVNYLELESVGDTDTAYSVVFLDRYRVSYPAELLAEGGELHGVWSGSGLAEVGGFPTGGHVLDVTEPASPRWLRGAEAIDGTLRFSVEENRSYRLVGSEAVRRPSVVAAGPSRLKSELNGADYLVVGPRTFLEAARPLLELRRREGLRVDAVAVEDIVSEFGFGEPRPEAIRDFLSFAYHHWREPSPSYVVLLGDASYDFKDYLGTGAENHVPAYLMKTSYLWTASDPTLAAINGEDLLPDVAIGRLPASTVEEARTMVEKIIAYETGEAGMSGPIVLVADNADRAGDFPRDADAIADELLSGRTVRKIYLNELGRSATRGAIVDAFEQGASLVSYVGHGGIHLWGQENLFDIGSVGGLSPQPQQPFVLTMNCLNGYFHFPYFNSLAEELLKAEAKGAIAAFAPSGLSLNAPARTYHGALLGEIIHGSHVRLGDAVLAAQSIYADSGAFAELLSIYHLFGDPALRLR